MQAPTSEAVASIGGITETIAQMSEITVSISTAMDQQGDATREIARNIQSVAAGSSEISDHIGGGTTTAAPARTGPSPGLPNPPPPETPTRQLPTAPRGVLAQ